MSGDLAALIEEWSHVGSFDGDLAAFLSARGVVVLDREQVARLRAEGKLAEQERVLQLMDQYGADAPLSVVFIGEREMTDEDIRRGQEIAAEIAALTGPTANDHPAGEEGVAPHGATIGALAIGRYFRRHGAAQQPSADEGSGCLCAACSDDRHDDCGPATWASLPCTCIHRSQP